MNSQETPPTEERPLIELKDLSKRYGRVRALRELSLEVPRGAVGLLGPNGAGKTTLLKLLLGLLEPTSGSALIGGYDPRVRAQRVELRRKIGYMPESDCLIPQMNAVELVAVLGRLSGLEARDAMTRAHEVLDFVGLDEERYRDSQEFSTGMKQRLKLAQALVHDPDILLLDEPTNGLDPKGRREMLDLVSTLGRDLGKSLLLCSHLLPDVERTCDHVVVLSEGSTRLQGRIAELTAHDGEVVVFRVRGDRARFAQRLVELGHEVDLLQEDALRVFVPGNTEDFDEFFALARDSACFLTAVEPARSSLEDVFLAALSNSPQVA